MGCLTIFKWESQMVASCQGRLEREVFPSANVKLQLSFWCPMKFETEHSSDFLLLTEKSIIHLMIDSVKIKHNHSIPFNLIFISII